ncbi:maleylpyruvate isomerase N-terminal domain-containing protein [Saccharothrix variisporea]|uniref:maleylpyruvate isomerase N-terminal domain-containing protein n=1 Tax=Saccharothrix variisporea TaxID=543527 RepID=UPI000EB572E5|nr:maleylpyruvate isomerase N-terminal domain-containing protein [Saccharothrix variisporea]
MSTSWADLVLTTAHECADVLAKGADGVWSRPAGDVDWSCRAVLDHVAVGQVGYAGLVVAQPRDRYVTLFTGLDAGAPIERCLESLRVGGTLLSWAIEKAPADLRAWHPWGTTDVTGIAAMAVMELAVHTYDIAHGLGLGWVPPDEWLPDVLARLFPDAPHGHTPADTLLHSTGRTDLPGLPRRRSWRVHAAPRPARNAG